MHVLPELIVRSARVVAQIDVIRPRFGITIFRPPDVGGAVVMELVVIAQAAMRTGNSHLIVPRTAARNPSR